MPVKPIRPNEVEKAKAQSFPDAVIESFNELIKRHFTGRSATFTQDEVVKLIASKGLKRKDIFDNHWLDVEPTYRDIGWKVEFDKPGYNEDYDAMFTFTKVTKQDRN